MNDDRYTIEDLDDLTEALRAIGTYADGLEQRLTTANPQGPMVRKAITQGALDDAITYVAAKQREAGARLETIDENASDALRVKVGALARIETLRDVIGWLEGLRDGDLDLEDVNRIEAPLPTPETHPIAPMQPVGAAEYGAPARAEWDYTRDAHAERVTLAGTLRRARAQTTIGGPYTTAHDVPCPVCGVDSGTSCRAEV